MNKNGYIKKCIITCNILLFIISIITPSAIGYNSETDNREIFDNVAFNCYNEYDFSREKYYMEHLEEKYINNFEKENVMQMTRLSQNEQSSGLMDSAWPMKCHDTYHSGRSPYSTADNDGIVKWQFKTDNWIEDGPVIDLNGTIYFGSGFDNIPWYLIALNSNGTLKWKYKTGGLIWSAPAIAEDGTIYIGSYDNNMYAINTNGLLKWKFNTGGSISSSPAVAKDGTIYFGTMRELDKGDIYAINPNGTEKWHYETGYYVVSDPAIGDDGTIYIGSGDSYFYALYPNGTLRWRFKTGDWIKSHPSIAYDGTIYISSFDNYLYALYPNGTLKWKYSGGGDEASPSIDKDGIIYVGNEYLHAIYPNGTRKWRIDGGPNIDHSSPAISSDGTIYVGAGEYIIAVNSDGSEKWRKKIANLWVVSSPSIDIDGTVYIGTSSEETNGDSYGYLYAIGTPDKPQAPTIIGLTKGKIGEKQYYTLNTTDYQGDNVEYYMDWGDGVVTGWIGPYQSGMNVTVNHTWKSKDTYTIKAKARDVYGHESEWSTLTVTMPKIHIHNPIIQLILKMLERFSFFEKILKQ